MYPMEEEINGVNVRKRNGPKKTFVLLNEFYSVLCLNVLIIYFASVDFFSILKFAAIT